MESYQHLVARLPIFDIFFGHSKLSKSNFLAKVFYLERFFFKNAASQNLCPHNTLRMRPNRWICILSNSLDLHNMFGTRTWINSKSSLNGLCECSQHGREIYKWGHLSVFEWLVYLLFRMWSLYASCLLLWSGQLSNICNLYSGWKIPWIQREMHFSILNKTR